VEAIGTSREGSNLAVEALGRAIAQAGGNEGEYPIEVPADRLRELLEGREARARRPATPRHELPPRGLDLPTAEDLGEGHLEQVRPVQRPVGTLDVGELVALGSREIPGILQQRPAGPLERRCLGRSCEQLRLLAANLVDGILREALYVEAVEDDLCLWRSAPDGVDVRT